MLIPLFYKKPKADVTLKAKESQSATLQNALKKVLNPFLLCRYDFIKRSILNGIYGILLPFGQVDYKALSAQFQKAKDDQDIDGALKLIATGLNEKLKDVPLDKPFYAEDGLTWRKLISLLC